jgi:FkbM family methyltransferase
MKLLEWVSPQVTEFIYTVLLYPRPLRAIAQRIIKAAIPPTLTVNGVRMVLNQDDPVLCGALALGAYERFELSVFRDTLKPGMNVLDIGANIGLFAAAAAHLLNGNGRIVAIEPDADNCGYLAKTIALNNLRGITIVEAAASNADATTELFLCPDNKADHRIFSKGARTARRTRIVKTVTMDAVVAGLKLDSVDVIKLDIQGAEGLALAGMQNILANNPSVVIFMEFWPWGLTQAGTDAKTLLRNLRDLGFTVSELNGNTRRIEMVSDEVLLQRDKERHHSNLLLQRPPSSSS